MNTEKKEDTPFERLLRLREVCHRTGLSRSAVYRGIAAGEFPKQVRLSRYTVAWVESEVDQWVADRIAKR